MKTLIIGAGGAGINYLNREGAAVAGADTVGISCDAGALESCRAAKTLQIGLRTTKGLGAGANPETGRKAAEESAEEIAALLGEGYDFAVIVCGLGGGDGQGAAPVIARIAREMGVFVAAVVTLPFRFEGASRGERAAAGLETMKEAADLLFTIPNDHLLDLAEKGASLPEVMKLSDSMITAFAGNILCAEDVKGEAVVSMDGDQLKEMLRGRTPAYCGYGICDSGDCVSGAAAAALSGAFPVEGDGISGASGIVFTIAGDVGLSEVFDAVSLLRDAAGGEPDIAFAVVYDGSRERHCELTVVAVK